MASWCLWRISCDDGVLALTVVEPSLPERSVAVAGSYGGQAYPSSIAFGRPSYVLTRLVMESLHRYLAAAG
ncbi:hypothetical protein ACFX13_008667 [Malus domestica]